MRMQGLHALRGRLPLHFSRDAARAIDVMAGSFADQRFCYEV